MTTEQINAVGHSGPHRAAPDNRVEAGSINIPPGSFPASSPSGSTDAGKVAEKVTEALNHALGQKDPHAVSNLFHRDGYWRDHLCLSWDLRTLAGAATISEFLRREFRLKTVELDNSAAGAPRLGVFDVSGKCQGVQFFIRVKTVVGTGRGVVRLVEVDAGEWKVFTIYTVLRELTGFEEPVGPRRSRGEYSSDDKIWRERRAMETDFGGASPHGPTVLIIGAGQAGLTCAARLKMLNVPTLVVDREAQVGDSWRKRYSRLVLHDPVWYDHMPYLSFPDNWPIFTPKDKLAGFFQSYVEIMELNVWTNTELVAASWDEEKKEWAATVRRRVGLDGPYETRVLNPRHIIQATGHAGKKHFPTIDGMSSFKGRLCHSSEFPGATPNSVSKRAIVIGSCNSGLDIAQDFYANGYDVTVVQRSSTCVVSSKSITDIALKGLYSEDGPPTADADLLAWSVPTALSKAQHVQVTAIQNAADAEILRGLAAAGFQTDTGPHGAGLIFKYYQRGGGYYIDVGAGQMITEGKIKIKQGQEVVKVLPEGLELSDGSTMPADEIVLATGFENMRTQTRAIFGDAVADRIGDVWGLDAEGELRTIWRRSGHPGLWVMGGNLAMARYFSRVVALQIKALVEGIASYGEV